MSLNEIPINSPPEEGCPQGGVVEIDLIPSPVSGEGACKADEGKIISTTPSGFACHPSSGGEFFLPPSEIHFYYFRFEDLNQHRDEYSAYLSPDEIERANRFYFEPDQHRFKIARGKLRSLLGEYLACDPKTLTFIYGEQGKPSLSSENFQFNLAHTRHAFLIGLNLEDPIGVDLEFAERDLDPIALSTQIMSPLEKKYFETHSPEKQRAAFLRAWVRKEAFVKAVGVGIGIDLKAVTVTPNQESAHTIEYENQTWQVFDLPKQDKHHLAIAIKGKVTKTITIC